MPLLVVIISIHALREEGDKVLLWFVAALMEFLSTPSARRATKCVSRQYFVYVISIHAPREEGD